MTQYRLVIGNKAYSSWSLRPWLLMKEAGLAFEEIRIPLYQDGHAAKIRQHTPAGRVPVLHDGAVTVWDERAPYMSRRRHHPRSGA